MWKTVLVSAAVTVALTIAIGAGVIGATSDGRSATPSTSEIAATDTVTTTDSSVQPAFFDTDTNAGAAAPVAVDVDMQPDQTPAPQPSATPQPEDAWQQMEGMHGADHLEWMRQHMDDVHGEGSFDSMLESMGGGMMGGDGGGMMGGGSGSGMTGGGMMGW